MAEYLVEAPPAHDQDGLRAVVARACAAAADMSRDGIAVRYLRPILVPEARSVSPL